MSIHGGLAEQTSNNLGFSQVSLSSSKIIAKDGGLQERQRDTTPQDFDETHIGAPAHGADCPERCACTAPHEPRAPIETSCAWRGAREDGAVSLPAGR